MNFANPAILFGLAAILIPIAIHLFNFRRFRKMAFTNVRLLRELKFQTRRQSQLRHWLILASRILAIACVVLAFAQPYFPHANMSGKMATRDCVSIYVDNSFSMQAEGPDGSLFDEARAKARAIAAAYKSTDRFQLLSNEFDGRQQHFIGRDEFLNQLDALRPGPFTRNLSEVLRRQCDLLLTGPGARQSLYVVSDFQQSAFGQLGFQPDSAIHGYLVPLSVVSVSNVFIDSAWFAQPTQVPGKNSTLAVRVVNFTGKDLEKFPVKLTINGLQKAIATLSPTSGNAAVAELNFNIQQPGIQKGLLEITDYPITFDDRLYFAYNLQPALRVLSINGNQPDPFLNALYAQDSLVKLANSSEKNLDYSSIPSFDLVILNQIPNISTGLLGEISRFVANGGSTLVIPAPNADLMSYTRFTSALKCPVFLPADTSDTRVVSLNTENVVFKDVFVKPRSGKILPDNAELPTVRKHYPLAAGQGMLSVSLMGMLNSRSFLYSTSFGNGKVYQLAVPLDGGWSDFQRQAVFVPALYNIALYSKPLAGLYGTVGDGKAMHIPLVLPPGDAVFKLKAANGEEIIPQMTRDGNQTSVFSGNLITQAGNYDMLHEGVPSFALAYNYNRAESHPERLDADALDALLSKNGLQHFKVFAPGEKQLTKTISMMNNGTRVWKYFLIAALLFVLIEMLLIRFMK